MNIFENAKKDEFGIAVENIDFTAVEGVLQPGQIRDEIPTMNRFGYMKVDLDEFCLEFINYAKHSKDLMLELGCAYGFVAQQVLIAGGNLVVNDLSFEHLSVLIKNTPQNKRKNLHVYQGEFPKEVNFPKESFEAILSSRMLHFLKGEDIATGLAKIHEWLKPQGKFFYTGVSPYNKVLEDTFLDIYKQRIKEGVEWPGEVNNFNNIAKEHAPFVQNFLHAFDIPDLETLLPKHGFKIEKIKLFDYPNNIDSNNKGHIGFVATKN